MNILPQFSSYTSKVIASLFAFSVSSAVAAQGSTVPLNQIASNHSGGSAVIQLTRMMEALEKQSYQGTLTYEFGGPLETLSFKKMIAGNETHERIKHLSGKSRDFLRKTPGGTCRNAASRLLLNANGADEVGTNDPLVRLNRFYSFRRIGQNRIADRLADIIQIRPRKADRYGMTLGIDRDSSLPLMMTVNDIRGKVLERFQFVELSLAPTIGPLHSEQASQRLLIKDRPCEEPIIEQGWVARWLPDGYALASTSQKKPSENGSKTYLSFTDGLSSISIFVAPAEQMTGAVGVVQRGATVAAMTLVAKGGESFKVSVVGEVPPSVAHKVAASIAYIP